MRNLVLLLCFGAVIILLPRSTSAQAEVSGIFLLISPSPQMNSMGGVTGVSIPSSDPISQFYNPANGRANSAGLSATYLGYSTPWLPGLVNDISYEYRVGAFSYQSKDSPWSVGLSYHHNYLDLGKQFRTGESSPEPIDVFHSYMRADAGYLRLSYLGPVHVSTGLGVKNAIQALTEGDSARSENQWLDFGILSSFPMKMSLPYTGEMLHLLAEPSVGYSFSNYGDEVQFPLDTGQADPAPRVARIGGTMQVGLQWGKDFDFIRYTVSHAAEDILVKSRKNHDDPIRYQSGLGDIDLVDHVLHNREDADVTVYKGTELLIGGVYAWREGRYVDVDGHIDVQMRGYGVYPFSIFRTLLKPSKKASILRTVFTHFDISYHYAEYLTDEYDHPLADTNFETWRLSLLHLEKLFWASSQE